MNSIFNDPGFWHRLQFAFTIIYHYLFPQLTMGLAWFLVYWKWRALRTGDEKYNQAARFWAKIFGLNFAVGVVTGIPMEFQFGTNWAGFSKYAGGVIGQTLAMEGMFAFFLESAFVGALIWGEKRLGPRVTFLAALAVALGSWLSGYFILVTNAFMQHPVGYRIEADGSLGIDSLSAYLLNPWAWVQFAHNQMAALVTGSFVVAAVGAFYALRGLHPVQARLYLRAGTFVGLIASLLVAFPTGDQQAKMVGNHQPVTLAAMEGIRRRTMAGVALIGQPNVAASGSTIRSKFPAPSAFSPTATLEAMCTDWTISRRTWPDNIELLYYSFHLMITLGTMFIVLMGYARIPEPARPTRIQPLAALGADAGVPISLHRQHAGLDDGGVGTPTLADLRSVSHVRRLQQSRQQRRHGVHPDRLRRPLFCARCAVSVSGRSRDQSRTR